MKVKLLKKLRKRFIWKMKEGSCWYYYDRQTQQEYYAFSEYFPYVNDMLQCKLLSKLGLSHLFVALNKRREKRRLETSKRKTIEEYEINHPL